MAGIEPLWSANDAATAMKIACPKDAGWNANGISIDSRTLEKYDIFFAIKGESMDGHAYAKQAFEKGAAAVVVDHAIDGVPAAHQLVVADTHKALEDLGRAARARFAGRVVGVTGSVGKTSSKEALALALSAYGKTYATQGNLNNHYGVPLTLARMPANADFAVIEMGMNHAGEIHALTLQARPHVALISVVDAVHIEFFDSVEDIARAKSEIFDGVEQGGIAVLNADNAYVNICAAAAAHKGINQPLTFGEKGQAVQLASTQVSAQGTTAELVIDGQIHMASVQAIGAHWGSVIASVATVLKGLGLPVEAGLIALSQFKEPVGRGRLSVLAYQDGEVMLLDDSYNASPVSMKAAFSKLELLKASGVRTIAVLGEMRELGAQSDALHMSLEPALIQAKPDLVFAAGEAMKALYDALPEAMHGGYAPQAEDLFAPLLAVLRAGDMVLFKGSHGSHVYKLADEVRRHIET